MDDAKTISLQLCGGGGVKKILVKLDLQYVVLCRVFITIFHFKKAHYIRPKPCNKTFDTFQCLIFLFACLI